MVRSDDLASRIARLERWLDSVERSQRSPASPSSAEIDARDASPIDRLRDVVSVLQERIDQAGCDQGDAIAMRALLHQLRIITADLRQLTAAADRHLADVGAAVADARVRLEELAKIV